MSEERAYSSKIEMAERPYKKSNGVLADIKYFFFNKPKKNTLIKFQNENDRNRYNKLIFERTGFDVGKYKMLNIHRIEVNTTVDFLFDELMKWNSESCWWPNHIAKVHVLDESLSHIDVFLFGKLNINPGNKKQSPEFHFLRLFNLSILKKEQSKVENINDNAHYLFYKCSGGYPIGVFSLFTRNSIPENNEKGESQLFMMVSFNFYGINTLSKIKIITKSWEAIHNRVTANVLTRFKSYCEQSYSQNRF